MEPKKFKSLLISDFNSDVLRGYLNNDEASPLIEAVAAPFGQTMRVLVDKKSECWRQDYDFVVVWTQPESVIESFGKKTAYLDIGAKDILHEVDEFCSALLGLRERTRYIFVPTWAAPAYNRGYGMLDMKHNFGIENILMQMNLRVSQNLDKASNIYLLNAERWIRLLGKDAFNPKLWYMAKIPFGNEVFAQAMKEIKASLSALSGGSKKIIILDLDETLWGGVAGEIGWQNINLGGHDPVGEAYVDFQRTLKAMTGRGILLGIVSKNEERIALEAIKNHPEMALRLEDFAGWRINWEDKARNIVDLVSGLKLTLQSAVFIDNNPAEREFIRMSLPGVLVPEWPDDKMYYKKALLSLSCFDTASVTREDLERNRMYVTERERQGLKGRVNSLDEWLRALATKVEVQELNETNLQRAAQLLNKTSQMNLATRRMTEDELTKWARGDNRKLWTFRVSDKFGDSGLTGIVSIEDDGAQLARIIDFVLSCRVIGRGIEEAMLHVAVEHARSIGLKEVSAGYVPTSKNKPCLDFWKRSGFLSDSAAEQFRWMAKDKYPIPEHMHIARR